MSSESVTQQRVLEELHHLDPSRWFEVLDFIGYLRERAGEPRPQPGSRDLTARDLLKSGIVGLWADRNDLGSSLDYARWLRQQAEHRRPS